MRWAVALGAATAALLGLLLAVPALALVGDLDGDTDIDVDDINIILAARNMPATGLLAALDLDSDGVVTVLDARIAATCCTRPLCATGNNPPSITSPAAVSSPENQTVAADVDTTDPDGETEGGGGLTYSLTGGADQLLFTIDPNSGVLTFNAAPDFEAPGDANSNNVYEVDVTVTDSGPATDTLSMLVTVTGVNEPPSITSDGGGPTAALSVPENLIAVTNVDSTDPDGETEGGGGLTYSLTGVIDDALFSVDPNSGVLTFLAAPDFDVPGDADADNDYEVQVTVTDSGGLTDFQDITVTLTNVNEPPVLAAIGNQTVDELSTLSFTATATDPDAADTLTFSLDAASLAAGMTINGATGAFSWTPTEAQGPGVFPVTVTVTDDGLPAMSDFETFNITVNEANVAPVLGAIGNQSVDEQVNLAFTATATDADAPANTLTFSLDATSLAAGMTINGTTGAFSWTPTEAQGPVVFPVTVTVTDDGVPAMSDFETFNITVAEVNVAPVLGAIGNQSVDELVNLAFTATATDADTPANTLTFSLDAASLAAGMTINGTTGAFSWTPTEAQGPGVFPVTVTATDDGVPVMSDFETFNITVAEVNLAPVLGAIGGQAVNELVNLAFNAMATDADVPANALTFSLDAASLAAGMTINGATGAFSWTPTEAQGPGVYPVTVTVTDDGVPAMSDFETFNITVAEVNVPPAVTGESFDTIVNTVLENSAAPNTLSAAAQVHVVGNLLSNDSDADLPAQTLTASLNTQATPGAAIVVNVNGTFTYVSAPGDATAGDSFTYTVSDGFGGMTNGTAMINFFERVWYVQDNAAAGGLGRSTDPFDTLGEAETASLVNDFIFLYEGNTGTTPLDEGITLKNGQKLHGEGVGLSVNVGLNGNAAPTNLVTAGNEPQIDFTGGDAVAVAATASSLAAVEIRGLDLTSSGAGGDNAVDVSTSGANTVSLAITNNTIGGAVNAGIRVNDANTGAGTASVVTIANNTISATGNAVDVSTNNAGNLNMAFNDNTGITSAAGAGSAILIADAAGAGSLFVTSFANNTVLGSTAGNAVRILGAVFDSDPSDGDFDLVPGGNLNVGIVSDRVGGVGVLLGEPANRVSGNLGFGTVNAFSNGGAALSASGSGVSMGGTPPTAGFLLAIAGGTADAINGPAVALDPLTSNIQLGNLSSGNSAGAGISLNTVSGSFSATMGGITGSTGPGFEIIGGTVTSTYGGGITQTTAAPAVSVSGGHNTGTVTFQTGTISANAGPGLQFDNADGTYDFTGTTTLAGGDAGIDILNGSAGSFTFGSNSSITDPSGAAFNVDSSTGGNVTYGGTIAQNSAARAVRVNAKTGGTVAFNGSVAANTGSSEGIFLTNNGGGTVSFTSVLNIDTSGGRGFVATGGGTVNVAATAGDQSVASTAGQAVEIDGVTTGITFDSLSSTGSGAEGIELTNLGDGSSFTVSGATSVTNPANQGILLSSALNAGIDIDFTGATTIGNAGSQGIRIDRADTGAGASDIDFGTVNVNNRNNTGVFLDNVEGTADFGVTTIPNPNSAGGDGIRAEDSSALFTFVSTSISGTVIGSGASYEPTRGLPTSDGDGNGIFLKNNTGSFTVNGGTIQDIGDNAVDIRNSNNTILNGLTINDGPDGNSFSTTNSAILWHQGSNLTLNNCLIQNIGDDASAALLVDDHGMRITDVGGDLNITNTTFDTATGYVFQNAAIGNANRAVELDNRNGVDFDVTVTGSTFQNFDFQGLNLRHVGGSLDAVIGGPLLADRNTFTFINGSAIDTGPAQPSATGNVHGLLVQNNEFDDVGIAVSVFSGRGTTLSGNTGTHASIIGNDIDGTTADAIRLVAFGSGVLGNPAQFKANVTGNIIINIAGNLQGMGGGSGFFVAAEDGTDADVTINSNPQVEGHGAAMSNNAQIGITTQNQRSGDLDLVLTNNVFNNFPAFATGPSSFGIGFFQNGPDGPPPNSPSQQTVRFGGNNWNGQAGGFGETMTFDSVGTNTMEVEGFTGTTSLQLHTHISGLDSNLAPHVGIMIFGNSPTNGTASPVLPTLPPLTP